MHLPALRRVAALLTATVTASLIAATLTQPAAADQTPDPIAVEDRLRLYPGQGASVSVLANDVSPSGAELRLCRFPELDIDSDPGPRAVMAMEAPALFGGRPGEVMVMAGPRAKGTHVIRYFICDERHLVPARLVVTIRPVQPVDVTTVRGRRGVLRVTNHNTVAIRFWFGHARAEEPDGRIRIPAGATRPVRVQRHRVTWVAVIGRGGKGGVDESPGVADYGTVRGIKLRGKALPPPSNSAPLRGGLRDVVGRSGQLPLWR